jgi:uncharacterized protein YigE (DUF2233 family)
LQVTATEARSGAEAKLSLAVCENGKARLRVIDRPNGDSSSLADVMEQEGCTAGVNGGYFDPDFAPVGLLVTDSRMISPLRRARLISGVLSVVNGRVRIQRAAEYSPKAKPTQAVQCGPFLVDHAANVNGLEDSRRARRTFAAAGGHRFAIGVCSAVSLAELSRILVAGNIGPEFKVDRALNLDGGSSTAFWCKRPDGTAFSISEQKPVRDFVGVSR